MKKPSLTQRQMASRGGKALAAKLTPEQRSASARKAAKTRHAREAIQYGGDGAYDLISHGRKINQLPMSARDARERNSDRKSKGIEPRWHWAQGRNAALAKHRKGAK